MFRGRTAARTADYLTRPRASFRADDHSTRQRPAVIFAALASANAGVPFNASGDRMASVAVNPAIVASRRRLFTALFASTGAMRTDPALAMRRPGRTGVRETTPPASPDSSTFPPDAMRWLTRGTFGYSTWDWIAFYGLGDTDAARWQAWLALQLAPATIDDSICDARIASAGFVTLNKSANQLWTDHHSVTNDYYTRMLPVAETECATLIRQIYSQR